MSIKHLPAAAADIAIQQGWDDESLIIHLVAFIQDKLPENHAEELAIHFEAMAREENIGFEDPDDGGDMDEADDDMGIDP